MATAKKAEQNPGTANVTPLRQRQPVAASLPAGKRRYVSQADVPEVNLDQALRVPAAIADNYALQPTRPIDVAVAMGLGPQGRSFRGLTGAAIAYGLTEGGYNAATIKVLDVAKRILRPTVEGDDLAAKREAVLHPRVIGDFLRKYDGHKLPSDQIAKNVLAEMGVSADATTDTLQLVLDGARSVGFLNEIKGSTYVNLQGSPSVSPPAPMSGDSEDAEAAGSGDRGIREELATPPPTPPKSAAENRRVFVTHGKNRAFIEPIRELLKFGEMEAVVSVDRETVSQPVPDKVMNDMRSCGAAIIHVDEEMRLMDAEAKTYVILNPNVLIEIGAAMALYGRRFILLVKHGIELPSNLQGLFEVRYDGEKLDADATIKLLKAINDIKNHPLPGVATTPQSA